MTTEKTHSPGTILDASGRPARRAAAVPIVCPRCRKKKEDQKRTASSGFGDPSKRHPVCSCGHEFTDEVWNG